MPDIGHLISQLDFRTVIDICVVALIFYWLLRAVEGTRAIQIIWGVVILLLATAFLGSVFQLSTLNWLMRNAFPVLLIAVPVIFQPELRRALEQLGRPTDFIGRPFGALPAQAAVATVQEIVNACSQLARHRIGALMVVERKTGLQEYVDRGTVVDATVSARLLNTIFFPNTPLHDGAVIIRNDKIAAAGCFLPLSDTVLNEPELGTRHRAAVGISEVSDALAIVVSEETGVISIASNGKLVGNLAPDKLMEVLASLLQVKLKSRNGQAKERVAVE